MAISKVPLLTCPKRRKGWVGIHTDTTHQCKLITRPQQAGRQLNSNHSSKCPGHVHWTGHQQHLLRPYMLSEKWWSWGHECHLSTTQILLLLGFSCFAVAQLETKCCYYPNLILTTKVSSPLPFLSYYYRYKALNHFHVRRCTFNMKRVENCHLQG